MSIEQLKISCKNLITQKNRGLVRVFGRFFHRECRLHVPLADYAHNPSFWAIFDKIIAFFPKKNLTMFAFFYIQHSKTLYGPRNKKRISK